MRNSFFYIFCVCFLNITAQVEPGKSIYEIRWALLHPVCALKVWKIYHTQKFLYDTSYLKTNGLNSFCDGQTDAFRHIFFMALFAQKCSEKKIWKLGLAHEKKNLECFMDKNCRELCPSDTLSILMDLHNNLLGLELGKKFPSVSPEMLRSIVMDYILKEHAFVIVSGSSSRILTLPCFQFLHVRFKKKKIEVLRK